MAPPGATEPQPNQKSKIKKGENKNMNAKIESTFINGQAHTDCVGNRSDLVALWCALTVQIAKGCGLSLRQMVCSLGKLSAAESRYDGFVRHIRKF